MRARNKKIVGHVIESPGGYTAQVLRRGTSRGTTVEREQTGFGERTAAEQWAAQALAGFLAERTARKTAKREQRLRAAQRRKMQADWFAQQTYQSLAEHCAANGEHSAEARAAIKSRAETLWQEIAFRALKQGEPENRAFAWANEAVGRNGTQRWAKAVSGDLDRLAGLARELAMANARRLAAVGSVFVEVEAKQGGRR